MARAVSRDAWRSRRIPGLEQGVPAVPATGGSEGARVMGKHDEMTYLDCSGVGRDAEYSRCLVVYFNRAPSDEEMRRAHDAVTALLRTDTVTDHAHSRIN
jgi:hypothetical protein